MTPFANRGVESVHRVVVQGNSIHRQWSRHIHEVERESSTEYTSCLCQGRGNEV